MSYDMVAYGFKSVMAKFVKITCYMNSENEWNNITECRIYSPTLDGSMPLTEGLNDISKGFFIRLEDDVVKKYKIGPVMVDGEMFFPLLSRCYFRICCWGFLTRILRDWIWRDITGVSLKI